MAEKLRLTSKGATAFLLGLADIEGDGIAGTPALNMYKGVKPSTAQDMAPPGDLITSIALKNFELALPSGPGAKIELDESFIAFFQKPGNVLQAGLVTWFRIMHADGVSWLDGTVGLAGADINLPVVDLVPGQSVRLKKLEITLNDR